MSNQAYRRPNYFRFHTPGDVLSDIKDLVRERANTDESQFYDEWKAVERKLESARASYNDIARRSQDRAYERIYGKKAVS